MADIAESTSKISFEKYSLDRGCEDVDNETLRPVGEQMLVALKERGFFYLTNSGLNNEIVSRLPFHNQ